MLNGVSTITRNKSLKEQAYDILKEMILTGKLEQGKIYNEKTIAEVLGVSRTPVREALLELSREGMVKFLPSKGIQVRKLTEKQVREVFEIRRIIEGHVIQTIARTLTSTDIKKIEAILKKQGRLSIKNEDIAFIETDKEFHLFLASKMGNQQIRAILQNLRDQIHVMGIRAIKVGSRVEQVLTEHRRILSALKEGDGKRAAKELMQHLGTTERILIEMMELEEANER
jgi:DNA-binding GntR family transcriptional regulator